MDVRYEGHFDEPDEGPAEVTAKPDFPPPTTAPETCSLCRAEEPRHWYELEPPLDAGAPTEDALDRWWAVCPVCHQLLAAVGTLETRVADSRQRSTWKAFPRIVTEARLYCDIEKP